MRRRAWQERQELRSPMARGRQTRAARSADSVATAMPPTARKPMNQASCMRAQAVMTAPSCRAARKAAWDSEKMTRSSLPSHSRCQRRAAMRSAARSARRMSPPPRMRARASAGELFDDRFGHGGEFDDADDSTDGDDQEDGDNVNGDVDATLRSLARRARGCSGAAGHSPGGRAGAQHRIARADRARPHNSAVR